MDSPFYVPLDHKEGVELEQFVHVFGFGRLTGETDKELRKRFMDKMLERSAE